MRRAALPARAAAAALGLALLLGPLAQPALSGTEALVRYTDTGDANVPKFRYLNGTVLSAEQSMTSLGADTKYFAALTEAPTRHEYLHVAVQGGGEARAQVWKQSSKAWGDPVTLTATGPGTGYASVAAAHERSSGDAVAVYSDNTATPKYRVWDGAAWGSQASISVGTTGIVQHLRLAAKPGADTLALVLGDANSDSYAIVWNGTAWSNGVTLTTTGGSMTSAPFDAAWEGTSGDLLVVYDNGTATPMYRTWNGAAWSAEAAAPSIGNGQTSSWVRLAPAAGSDTILLGVQDSAGQLELCAWSGTAWCGSVTQATNKIPSTSARGFDLAVEAASGDGLVAYGSAKGANQDLVRYRTYAAGTWSAEADAPDVSTGSADLPQWALLGRDPRSNNVTLLQVDAGNRVGYQRWTGTAWANTTELETASDKGFLHLAASYRSTAPGLPWLDTDGTYSFESSAFGSVDALQAPGRLIFSDGVAGRVYNRTGAGASGTWGQWAANPGILGVLSGTGAELAGRYIQAFNNATAPVAETFTFEACGEDGEADLSHVRVGSTHAGFNDTANLTDGNGYAITSSDRANTSKPTTGPGIDQDGYAVWNPTSSGADCLAAQYRHTWDQVAKGTYTQTAHARNAAGTWAEGLGVHRDTTEFDPAATATLDFTQGSFAGAVDAAFQVAIDNRIDFTWHVGTEADPSAIGAWEGSASNDPDGAVAIVVPETGRRLWLYYSVDMVNPSGVAVLLDQAYTASYTWS